jgi:acetyl esterase/lipase
MQSHGELRIDPADLGGNSSQSELALVVAYSHPELTRTLLRKAAELTAGLQARISLVAVHTVPYPAPFRCPTSTHTFLVDQLIELAGESSLPVTPLVVLARSREEGFRSALPPDSTVLVGSHRHFWRTEEESLARNLADNGHKVALIHIQ